MVDQVTKTFTSKEVKIVDRLEIPNLTTTERNNIPSPKDGEIIWNTTEDQVEIYNGSAWEAVGSVETDPTFTSVTINQPGNLSALTIDKTGTSVGNVIQVDNDGIGNSLLLRQNGNATGLNISGTGTTSKDQLHIESYNTSASSMNIVGNSAQTSGQLVWLDVQAATATVPILNITNSGSGNYIQCDSTKFVVESDGKTGIGKNPSGYKLESYDETQPQLSLSGYGDGSGGGAFANARGEMHLGTNTSYRAKFKYTSSDLIFENVRSGSGSIIFKTQTAGTPVTGMTINYDGSISMNGTVTIGALSALSAQLPIDDQTQEQLVLTGWANGTGGGGFATARGELHLGTNTSYMAKMFYDTSHLTFENARSDGRYKFYTKTSGTPNQVLNITADANLIIGGTSFGTSATNTFVINNGTAPTSSVGNGVQLYAEDVSASSELKVRDEAGNVTTLSPHNFKLFQPNQNFSFPWSYYSKNEFLGKEINVDMYKMCKILEQLTGEQIIYENNIPKKSWNENQLEIKQKIEEENAELNKKIAELNKELSQITDTVKIKKINKILSNIQSEIKPNYIPKDPPQWLKDRI